MTISGVYTPFIIPRDETELLGCLKIKGSIPKFHRLESHFPINIAMFREFYGHAPNKPLKHIKAI